MTIIPGSRSTTSKESLTKSLSLSSTALMSPRFHKFKLLLDENMPARRKFALLNRLFDVKHLAFDLRKGGFPDAQVYQEAVKMHRLIITFNGKDFKPMAANSKETGVIFISQN